MLGNIQVQKKKVFPALPACVVQVMTSTCLYGESETVRTACAGQIWLDSIFCTAFQSHSFPSIIHSHKKWSLKQVYLLLQIWCLSWTPLVVLPTKIRFKVLCTAEVKIVELSRWFFFFTIFPSHIVSIGFSVHWSLENITEQPKSFLFPSCVFWQWGPGSTGVTLKELSESGSLYVFLSSI